MPLQVVAKQWFTSHFFGLNFIINAFKSEIRGPKSEGELAIWGRGGYSGGKINADRECQRSVVTWHH